MNELINIQNHDGQLTVSSREVAENFEKEHRNVLQAVDEILKGVAEKSADLFIESKYQHEQNKQWYKEYQVTRDGFTLLAMGFTGAKALEWKLKYIEAFNQMESELRKPMTLTEIVAANAQQLVEVEKRMDSIDAKVKSVDHKLTGALDVFTAPVSDNWRQEMNDKINQICLNHGLSYLVFRHELYNELESSARCNLESRQRNLKKRLKSGGAKYAELKAITKIDVIDRDPKLRLIFEGIVRKYQAKYAG